MTGETEDAVMAIGEGSPEVIPLRPVPGRRALAFHALLLYILCVPIGLYAGIHDLQYLPVGTSALGWMEALVAFVTTVAMLAMPALLLSCLTAIALPWRWVAWTTSTVLLAFTMVFIRFDATVYALYRCHFNGMVWDVLSNRAAADTLTIPFMTKLSATLVILMIVVATCGASVLAATWLARWRWRRVLVGIGATLVLMAALADKTTYALGDLKGDSDITRVAQFFPFYLPMTCRRFAQRMGMDIERRDSLGVDLPHASALAYPHSVAMPKTVTPMNVLIVAIEGCRFDMLDPRIMPNLCRWATRNTTFLDNYSGGNATRFGIYSLMYGLYGSYWNQFLDERQGPFMIHALKQYGYHFKILSCTDLDFPEFRRTAFVEVPEDITDHWECARVDRDRNMTTMGIDFMQKIRSPFFCFMFYDASHAPYSYTPAHRLFTPVIRKDMLDYVSMTGHMTVKDLHPLFNRYRNSLHYVDEQLGRSLDSLDRRGLLANTLVFIVGDHGEEFGELGYQGHNGSFDPYQVRTVLAAHIPGMEGQRIDRLTSHMDIVPTVFEHLGITVPPRVYCEGVPLDSPAGRDHVVVASWMRLALIDHTDTFVVGLGSYNPTFHVFDSRRYAPVPDKSKAIAAHKGQLLHLISAMSEFDR